MALSYAAKQAETSLEVQNLCAELKLRAERRVGELPAEQERHQGGRPPETCNTVLQVSPPTCEEMGIDRMQASRWQRIVAVPEPEFEHYIEEKKQAGEEITTAGVIRLASTRAEREQT